MTKLKMLISEVYDSSFLRKFESKIAINWIKLFVFIS